MTSNPQDAHMQYLDFIAAGLLSCLMAIQLSVASCIKAKLSAIS